MFDKPIREPLQAATGRSTNQRAASSSYWSTLKAMLPEHLVLKLVLHLNRQDKLTEEQIEGEQYMLGLTNIISHRYIILLLKSIVLWNYN